MFYPTAYLPTYISARVPAVPITPFAPLALTMLPIKLPRLTGACIAYLVFNTSTYIRSGLLR